MIGVLPALIVMLSAAVHADTRSVSYSWYGDVLSKQGTVKISLSGECSGTVTLDIVGLSAGVGFGIDGDGNALPGYGFSMNSYAANNGFYFGGGASQYAFGEAFTEVVNGNKVKQSFVFTDQLTLGLGLNALMDSHNSALLRCKNGQSFYEQSVYYPVLHLGGQTYTHKSSLQLTYDKSKLEQGASAVLKQQFTGTLYGSAGQCGNKGSLDGDKYTLSCGPLKPVKVKIVVNAKATVYQSL